MSPPPPPRGSGTPGMGGGRPLLGGKRGAGGARPPPGYRDCPGPTGAPVCSWYRGTGTAPAGTKPTLSEPRVLGMLRDRPKEHRDALKCLGTIPECTGSPPSVPQVHPDLPSAAGTERWGRPCIHRDLHKCTRSPQNAPDPPQDVPEPPLNALGPPNMHQAPQGHRGPPSVGAPGGLGPPQWAVGLGELELPNAPRAPQRPGNPQNGAVLG